MPVCTSRLTTVPAAVVVGVMGSMTVVGSARWCMIGDMGAWCGLICPSMLVLW